MKNLSKKELEEISGGGLIGVISKFFRISQPVYAPSEPDAVGEAKRLKEKERKERWERLSKPDPIDRRKERLHEARERREDRASDRNR